MPNNYIKYQQSISNEFLAIKDRVRFFIEDRHWGEDGRFKEMILSNYLRKILPNYVGVGSGFIKNNKGEISTQIDIIVYNINYPKLFSEGDFVILMPESVYGIIEVKSSVTFSNLSYKGKNNDKPSVIEKCHENGKIIGNKKIFNGIFSYESNSSSNFINERTIEILRTFHGYLNHISFNQDMFCRYWNEGNPSIGDKRKCYSFYNLSSENGQGGLSYGYFISNLLETIYSISNTEILMNTQYYKFLYPITGTKETNRMTNKEIYI